MKLLPILLEILKESPFYMVGDMSEFGNHPAELQGKLDKGKFVGNIIKGGKKYPTYVEEIADRTEQVFLNPEKTKILAFIGFAIKKIQRSDSYCIDMIWNAPEEKGFVKWWIDNKVIPVYTQISSDTFTKAGVLFFKKLYDEYVTNKQTHILLVYDEKTKRSNVISNFEDIGKYKNNDSSVVLRKV